MSRNMWSAGVTAGLIVVSVPASAVLRTWDGSALNNDWGTASNWSPAGVPTTSDDIIIGFAPVNDVRLSSPTPGVESIALVGNSGASLDTNGTRLVASAFDSSAFLSVNSGNLVRVRPRTDGGTSAGLDVDQLDLNAGGVFRVDLGATAQIDDNADLGRARASRAWARSSWARSAPSSSTCPARATGSTTGS